ACQIDNQLGCLFPNNDRRIRLPLNLPESFELFLINDPARSDAENDKLDRKQKSGPNGESIPKRPIFHAASPIRYPAPRTVWMSLIDSPSSILRRNRWI